MSSGSPQSHSCGGGDVFVLSASVARDTRFAFAQDALFEAFKTHYGGLRFPYGLTASALSCVLALKWADMLGWAAARVPWVWFAVPLGSLFLAVAARVHRRGGSSLLALKLMSLPVYSLHQVEEHWPRSGSSDSPSRAFLAKLVAKAARDPGLDFASPVDDAYLFLVNVYGIWVLLPLMAWLAGQREHLGGATAREEPGGSWYPLLMCGVAGNLGVPFVNGALHLASACVSGEYNPGLFTATVVLIPYGICGAWHFWAARMLDGKRAVASLCVALLTHFVVWCLLVLQAWGFLTAAGVRGILILALPLLALAPLAIPAVKHHKNASFTVLVHQAMWHLGLARLSPRMLQTARRIFENVRVAKRTIVPPGWSQSSLFRPVGSNYRSMLETSGRPVFEEIIACSAEQVLAAWPGSRGDIGWLFLASDSTQHFINALPNLAIKMVSRLGLSWKAQHYHLSLMGCCGGLQALSACIGALKAVPGGRGLVLLFEATGTQNAVRQRVLDRHDLLQMGLFGDGATAALVASGPLTEEERGRRKLKVRRCERCIVDGTAELLSHANHWDHVYSVVETSVPGAIKDAVPKLVLDMIPDGVGIQDVAFLVHPGGPRVLESVAEGLGLNEEQLRSSWSALRNHGNMSGATNLAVLSYFLASPEFERFPYALALAFGPGICVQAILFEVCGAETSHAADQDGA